MLLKTLKLSNFRQFIGEQSISFAADPDKNVTVIMGENGSGKTTLAQAFTWCLYGVTDFDDSSMLCKAVAQTMLPNAEAMVRVELSLMHNDTDYTIIREQRYSKDGTGSLRRPGQTSLKIAFKNNDGQRDYIKEIETDFRLKEILPRELSRYFFFDGERIGKMSKEIRRGKSKEFSEAVRSLLGLNAFIEALDHLKGKNGRYSVIKSYNESYDARSDSKIAKYTEDIARYEEDILKKEKRIEEIENEELLASDKYKELADKIRANANSEKLAADREQLIKKRQGLISQKSTNIAAMLRVFNNNGPSYFTKKMMKDALQNLSKADKLDKGIPDIHARTIEFLINRGFCLCDNPISFGNEAHKALIRVLDYIPPQSIGSSIALFIRDCELKSKLGQDLFQDMSEKFSVVRDFDDSFASIEHDIKMIEDQLQGMEHVGELQRAFKRYEGILKALKLEREDLIGKKGGLVTLRDRCETERNELTLKDSNNRKIETYKAYAQYMYDTLAELYAEKESETRNELEKVVNEIFKSIYNGGFSLSIDEKYTIQVIVNNYEGYTEDVETSTAQSISIIFAFIAGVIKMAREGRNPENQMIISEPYPLVMDAPLSAFDKTRIKAVCDALPSIAEQVVIFIKDTDGELAEEYLGSKVGTRYLFDKKNEFETVLVGR